MSKQLTTPQKYYPTYSPQKHIDYEDDDYRIITKNLVYIIGLSESISYREILQRYEYLGQYGKILKIVINRKKAYNQNSRYGPSYSAYITYSKPFEACLAILSLENSFIDNHVIHASFGTTKYCSFYLKKQPCNNKDCVFLHKKANDSDIIDKCELNCSKDLFMSQQIIAIKIGDIYNKAVKDKILGMNSKGYKTVFPSPNLIYKSQIVLDNEKKIIEQSLEEKNNLINEISNKTVSGNNTCEVNNGNNINCLISSNSCTSIKKNISSKFQKGSKVIFDNKGHKKNIGEILNDSSDDEKSKKGKKDKASSKKLKKKTKVISKVNNELDSLEINRSNSMNEPNSLIDNKELTNNLQVKSNEYTENNCNSNSKVDIEVEIDKKNNIVNSDKVEECSNNNSIKIMNSNDVENDKEVNKVNSPSISNLNISSNCSSNSNNSSGSKESNLSNLNNDSSINKINTIIIQNKKLKLNELDTNTTITTSINSKDEEAQIYLTPKNAVIKNNILFTTREKSRFDFVNNNCDSFSNNANDNVNIPSFISNIINKSSKMIMLNKFFNYEKINYNNELFIYEEELNKIDDSSNKSWKDFIINKYNKNLKHDCNIINDDGGN